MKHIDYCGTGLRWFGVLLVVLILGGCSLFGSKDDNRSQAKSLPPLEVPPDLITPETTNRYQAGAKKSATAPIEENGTSFIPSTSTTAVSSADAVMPRWQQVEVQRDGASRWLLVAAAPEQVWPRVRQFLGHQGFNIAQDEPNLGFIETAWRERSEGEGLSLPGSRDGLRLRIEPAIQAGSTEIHLSLKSSRLVKGEWVSQAADSEDRSIEWLNRLARYLGDNKTAPMSASRTPVATPASSVSMPLAQPATLPEPATDMTAAEKATIDKRWQEIGEKCALCRSR